MPTRGAFEGRIGEVPVDNVATGVMRRYWSVFELGDDGLRLGPWGRAK